jgi:hypothetical protein
MASKTRKEKPLATFDYPLRVEVRKVKFKPLASVALLDLSRLDKGNHKIDVGFADGRCCARLVTAVVKSGVVTGIEIEGCKRSGKPISKQTIALVEAARRAINAPMSSPWTRVPVAEFFASASQMSRLIVSWGDWCITICWDLGQIHCLTCCLWPPMCDLDPIVLGPLS